MRHADIGLRLPTLALSMALIASAASADSIPPSYQYSVQDSGPSPAGISGPYVLGFQGTRNGTLTLDTPFQVGNFVITPQPGQGDTTFHHAEFGIELGLPQFDQTTPLGPVGPNDPYPGFLHQINNVIIHGYLDGTVSSTGQSNVVATIDSVKPGFWNMAFIPEDRYNFEFPFPVSGVKVPSTIDLSSGPGQTHVALSAEIDATPVPIPAPEPTSIALFVAALGGLGLWRRHGATH